METLILRASNVVIAYGAARSASGTQVKEKPKQQGGGVGVEKAARLAEKKSPASGVRRFTLAPLPFPSARNLVPAPLRFLWFPESKNDEARSGIGSAQIEEVGELLNRGSREKEETDGGGEKRAGDLKPGDCSLSGGENSSPGAGGVEKEELEGGNAAKRWFQNLLSGNFLKKNSRIDAEIPAVVLLESAAVSASRLGSSPPRCDGGAEEAPPDRAGQIAGKNAAVGARGGCQGAACACAGCASEPTASPLTALEVPHVNVKHDFESFSKFLSEVPLMELKIIAQTSFLCNLAYVIPEIKAGDLARYHRMLFVTSSIDIKARVIAKEKAAAIAKEKRAAAAAKREAERSEGGGSAPKKEANSLSPARVYSLAMAAVSVLRSQRQDPDGAAAAAAAVEEENPGAKPVANPLDSDSMETFLGAACEGDGDETRLASDMPAFMRPVTSVVSAEKETRQEVADNLRSLHTCPCEWFSCDEKGGPTRFFSIQGSESFASWQANLLFEPMQFEDPELGVMVHRGIYEAALGLYDQIVPFVVDHLERYGERARFQFTGHSLGGSLAVLLSLMLNIRGVLKASALLPVYTFGAPYIMCGGDYLLQKLGLPLTHVQYVVMHRDIVPRSFACNYPDHIAEVLKTVNGTFRDHSCLTRQRLLYAPMGQLMVLQPDQRQASPHPLLPDGTGLYSIRHRSHNEPAAPDVPSRAVELRAAQRAFLNQPHPLEIISDPASYGSGGGISRNHDPRNYADAINGVLRQEMRRWRRVQRERRRQLWWPLISADAAIVSARSASFGAQREQQAARGPSGLGSFASNMAEGRAAFPASASGERRGRFSRYKRLIASRHVQMVLLMLLFTAEMLLEEGFAVFLTWV